MSTPVCDCSRPAESVVNDIYACPDCGWLWDLGQHGSLPQKNRGEHMVDDVRDHYLMVAGFNRASLAVRCAEDVEFRKVIASVEARYPLIVQRTSWMAFLNFEVLSRQLVLTAKQLKS